MNQMLKLKSEELKKNISSIEQQLLSAQIPKSDEELRRRSTLDVIVWRNKKYQQ